MAAWGSEADRRLLSSVEHRFPSVADLERDGLFTISEGFQLRTRDATEALQHHPELAGQPLLDVKHLRQSRYIFELPREALSPIPEERTFVRMRGGYEKPAKVCQPPHVIVNEARTLAVFSDEFIVVPPRQIGIAANSSGQELLKALSLFLNSDFVKYHQFFGSSQAGVQKQIFTLADLRKLPIPMAEADPIALRDWIDLHARLVAVTWPLSSSLDSHFEPLLEELNALTNDALGLSKTQRARVHDFVQVKLELRAGKTDEAAIGTPSTGDLDAYADMLRSQLDTFLDAAPSMWHQIVVMSGSTHGIVEIDLKQGRRPAPEVRVNGSTPVGAEALSLPTILMEQRSQWLYFQRNLRIYEGTKTYLFKPMQRFHWTRTQAVEDAADVIAETLLSEPE